MKQFETVNSFHQDEIRWLVPAIHEKFRKLGSTAILTILEL